MAPERNRRRPRHRGDDRARDNGDGDGCESDREYHQPRDWRPIVLEVSQRRVVRRVEQDRCNEQRQRKFGRKSEGRRGRKKGEQCTAECQEHRIRCSNAACCCRQNHRGDEETQELFEFPHITARVTRDSFHGFDLDPAILRHALGCREVLGRTEWLHRGLHFARSPASCASKLAFAFLVWSATSAASEAGAVFESVAFSSF